MYPTALNRKEGSRGGRYRTAELTMMARRRYGRKGREMRRRIEMRNLTKEIKSEIVLVRVDRLEGRAVGGGGIERLDDDVRMAARRAGSRRRWMLRGLEGGLLIETEGEARPEDLVKRDEGLLGIFSDEGADSLKGDEEIR